MKSMLRAGRENMSKQEKVGKVTLDYEFYSGEDLYSDGEIEDNLLEIVKNCEEDELENIITKKNDWVYLYHFSQIRQNIISWIPMKKQDKILEIGSGCGAITGALARKGGQVDCVELSRKRSLINAYRNRNYDGITIKVANFEKIEPYLDDDYDVITLIGVWEYANLYLSSENPYHYFLQLLKKHMKPTGRIIIAIENQFGLKYWAGCREDHTGVFFESLEGYTRTDGAKTFGKNQMQEIFGQEGLEYEFYYPYPDYKLPMCIYSDEYLPQKNELDDNGRNLDNNRLLLFDEKKVFNTLIQNNEFAFFSNSFLVILRKETTVEEEKIIYSKFLNDRSDNFSLRMDIERKGDGRRVLKKVPMHKHAHKHMQTIHQCYTLLEDLINPSSVVISPCSVDAMEDNILFDYYTDLDKIISTLMEENNSKKAIDIIHQTITTVKKLENGIFEESGAFRKIFGACPIQNVPAIKGVAINFLFQNLKYEKKQLRLFNYEWAFHFEIPVNYVIFRMVHYLTNENIQKENLFDEYGINSNEQQIYQHMEMKFQQSYVNGGKKRLSDSTIIKPKYEINEQFIHEIFASRFVKIYYNYGQGFSEDNAIVVPFVVRNVNKVRIPYDEKVKELRIDPMEEPGIIKVKKLFLEEQEQMGKVDYHTNGIDIESEIFLFEDNDPWIMIENLRGTSGYIDFEFSFFDLPENTVKKLGNKGKIKNRLKKVLKK